MYTCPVYVDLGVWFLQCVCGVYAGDYAHILAIWGSRYTRLGSERAVCSAENVWMPVCVCVNLSA